MQNVQYFSVRGEPLLMLSKRMYTISLVRLTYPEHDIREKFCGSAVAEQRSRRVLQKKRLLFEV